MTANRIIANLSLIVLLLAGCSSDGNPSGDMGRDASGERDGGGSASALIGATGGSVGLPDGTKVDIPKHALSGDTTITIMSSTMVAPNALGPGYVLGPEGTIFGAPVTITLPWDPSRLPLGLGEANLAVATAPVGGTTFSTMGGIRSDSTHLQAQTGHFSFFQVVFVAKGDASAR